MVRATFMAKFFTSYTAFGIATMIYSPKKREHRETVRYY